MASPGNGGPSADSRLGTVSDGCHGARVTMSGDIHEILTRDQRTTSHRLRDRCQGPDVGTVCRTLSGHPATFCDQVQGTCDRKRRLCLGRSKFTFTTWLRLVSLFVSLITAVQGAPMMTENRRSNSPPKWINPCGLTVDYFDGSQDVARMTDYFLLEHIILQVKTAMSHANNFREDYVRKTFGADFDAFHKAWQDNHYDWLPSVEELPKQLGEKLEAEYLEKLEVRMLDSVLINAYEYMQTYAVGLEQIVNDQEERHLEFSKDFADTEYQLKMVLCEIQVALSERGVEPRPDVEREKMPEKYKALSASNTHRSLRDWLIFRDYMNGLESLLQIFEHFMQRIGP